MREPGPEPQLEPDPQPQPEPEPEPQPEPEPELEPELEPEPEPEPEPALDIELDIDIEPEHSSPPVLVVGPTSTERGVMAVVGVERPLVTHVVRHLQPAVRDLRGGATVQTPRAGVGCRRSVCLSACVLPQVKQTIVADVCHRSPGAQRAWGVSVRHCLFTFDWDMPASHTCVLAKTFNTNRLARSHSTERRPSPRAGTLSALVGSYFVEWL
jgi:hypothetical protein